MARPVLVASLIFGITSNYATGQSTAPAASAPISTDRPTIAASSVVVPAGSLQVENGFTETVSQGQRTFDVPESEVRFGLASKTELRLNTPNYFFPNGGSSGFGDLAVGVKQQVGPTPGGFDISLIVSLSMPTGSNAFTSHGYDPFVQLPWSRSLSPNWTAAGMFAVYWPSQVGHRNETGEATFLLDRQLTKACDAFAAYVGDFAEQGGPRHLVHLGTAYKPTPNQQLDLHFGVGLSAAAVDHFIGVSYSFRLQMVRR